MACCCNGNYKFNEIAATHHSATADAMANSKREKITAVRTLAPADVVEKPGMAF